jgi:DNA polymerase-1
MFSLINKSKEELKNILDIITTLIDFSQTNIIKTTFIKGFYNNSIKGMDNNYRLYGNYRLFGTKTFRLTSNNVNMLNLPSTGSIYAKPIKQCFEANPGWIFSICDLQGLEDRVIANLSKDKNKCNIFLKNLDGHSLQSYFYFKEEIEKILPKNTNESLEDYIKRYYNEVEHKGNKELKAIRQKSKGLTLNKASSYSNICRKTVYMLEHLTK